MLSTPRTVVDLARVEANIERMAAAMRASGIALRPHAKTHKTVEIASRQIGAGAVGLTVATLHEARVFAAGGATDIFVAYPVWAVGSSASLLRDLHDAISLRIGIDSPEAAANLAGAIRGADRSLGVLVEIDSGLGRSGVAPDRAVDVARAASGHGLDVAGVFTHGGHAYFSVDPGDIERAASDEVRLLGEAAANLTGDDFDVRVVSAGSTPTARRSARAPVNEERPGTYVFGDGAQVALGACDAGDVALTVVATVVSTAVGGQVVVDAGSKALSSDRRPWQDGHGTIVGHDGCIVSRLSEEHGIVTNPSGGALPALGDEVAIVPNHVCSVVNLSPELVVVDGARVLARWPVVGRR